MDVALAKLYEDDPGQTAKTLKAFGISDDVIAVARKQAEEER